MQKSTWLLIWPLTFILHSHELDIYPIYGHMIATWIEMIVNSNNELVQQLHFLLFINLIQIWSLEKSPSTFRMSISFKAACEPSRQQGAAAPHCQCCVRGAFPIGKKSPVLSDSRDIFLSTKNVQQRELFSLAILLHWTSSRHAWRHFPLHFLMSVSMTHTHSLFPLFVCV